jgi:hypothetical protein
MGFEIIFFVVIAFLIAHELDAIRLREWQLLFVLRNQPDNLAYTNFVLLHIPIMVLLLWLTAHQSAEVRKWFQLSLDFFAVIHLGLHWRLRHRAQAGFYDPFSRILIFGFALAGAVHGSLLLFFSTPEL